MKVNIVYIIHTFRKNKLNARKREIFMNLQDRANKSGEVINRLRSELEKKQGKEKFSRNMKLARKNRLLMELLSQSRKS